MIRPSWFNVPFIDGLGNQLLAITQAYWFGMELGLPATQLMAPDKVNAALHALPRLSTSPNIHQL